MKSTIEMEMIMNGAKKENGEKKKLSKFKMSEQQHYIILNET